MEEIIEYGFKELIKGDRKEHEFKVNISENFISLWYDGKSMLWMTDFVQLKHLADLFQRAYEKAKVVAVDDEMIGDDLHQHVL